MRVFVTGATGFVGTNLLRALVAQGHDVTGVGSKDCDLTQRQSLTAFTGDRYDQVFHLAAWTQAGDFCLKHPGEQWVINQQINTNVLEWWQIYQPQAKLVTMGTSCAYAPDRELKEENYLEGTPIDSLFTYAMTKRMMYVGLLALARQYGLKYLCLVPSTLYGPGYHSDGRQMHFIFDLIRKILRGKKLGEPVVLWGNGHQKRELVFIDDFVSAVLDLASVASNEVINIGAGEEFSIRHFANVISKLVGFDQNLIQYDETRYVGAQSKCLDVAKLRRLLPNRGSVPLEEGIRQVIRWFEDSGAYNLGHPT